MLILNFSRSSWLMTQYTDSLPYNWPIRYLHCWTCIPNKVADKCSQGRSLFIRYIKCAFGSTQFRGPHLISQLHTRRHKANFHRTKITSFTIAILKKTKKTKTETNSRLGRHSVWDINTFTYTSNYKSVLNVTDHVAHWGENRIRPEALSVF